MEILPYCMTCIRAENLHRHYYLSALTTYIVEPMDYGHLGTNQMCQGVLIFQDILYDLSAV